VLTPLDPQPVRPAEKEQPRPAEPLDADVADDRRTPQIQPRAVGFSASVAVGTFIGTAELADAAGMPIAGLAEPAAPEAQSVQEQQRTIGILEAFYFYCHHFLVDPGRDPQRQQMASAFLAELGFDPLRLDELPMGLFLDRDLMEACLEKAGFTPSEIHRSGLTSDPRLSGRLVGPVRDRHGRIVSFWARHPRREEAKYLLLHKQWYQQIPAVGLDMALTPVAGGQNHLILIESLLDMLLLHCRGLFNVAAIGGPAREFTPERWEGLAGLGVHRVTLLVGRHRAGQSRLSAVLEHYFRAKAAPTLYVVPPEHWGETSGPGDLVRARGAEQLRDLVQGERMHAYHYQALALLSEHKAAGEWTDASRQQALAAAVDFHLSQARQHRRNLDVFFWPPIVAALMPEPPSVAMWEETEAVADAAQATPVIPLSPGGRGQGEGEYLESTPTPSPARGEGSDAKASAPAVRQPGKPGGYCELHRCENTDCFCFD